jgi:predicted HTH domain antitoxin
MDGSGPGLKLNEDCERLFARNSRPVIPLLHSSSKRTEGMIEIIIKLPDALARMFGETAEARSRRVTEDAAVEEYRAGRLSQRQVGEMLGFDYWQTEHFLGDRKVPLNYSLADLQSDRVALDEVLPRK